MGMIRFNKQDTLPENKGDAQLINGTYVTRAEVSSSALVLTVEAIDANKDTITLTYTSTAGSVPSDQDIFDAWEPMLVAAQGSVVTLIQGPTIIDDNDDILYPAVAIS